MTPKSACWRACSTRRSHRRFSVLFSGRGHDAYDGRGRVAQEAIFNLNKWQLPLPPATQQGYFAFSNLDTRTKPWILCGFAEQTRISRPCRRSNVSEGRLQEANPQN